MAKRTRGTNRPGHRRADRPGQAKPQPRPASRPSSALSDAEEEHAAELESRIVAQDRANQAAAARSRARAAEVRPARVGGQSLLEAKAAEEYAYVVRDVRRIVALGGTMVAIMGVLFVLVEILHVIKIS